MKWQVGCFMLLSLGCSRANNKSIKISLENNRTAIKFKGLNYAVISEINRDSALSHWQSLIPVYKLPADTELRDYQLPQPGKYAIADSALVFTPDTPFIKGKRYFLRYYKFGQDESSWDLIKGTKKPGTATFTDFNFTD